MADQTFGGKAFQENIIFKAYFYILKNWANVFLIFFQHKECILSQKHTTALLCFPSGFEPGSAVSEADAMSTAPPFKAYLHETRFCVARHS
jgi:hypothetical protein